MFLRTVLLTVGLVLAPTWVTAGETPNVMWRFDGNGRFPNIRPPVEWRSDRNVLWKTSVGIGGYSSPIVVRDKVFVTAEMGSLVCLALADGKVLWTKDLFSKDSPDIPADLSRKLMRGCGGESKQSTPTPTSNGELVFYINAMGLCACYDLQGHQKWIRIIETAEEEECFTSSPVFVGDKIVVSWGCLLALDAKDGRTLWKAADAQSAYGTPAIAKIGNDTVAITQGGDVVRLSDGAVLCAGQFRTAYKWSHTYPVPPIWHVGWDELGVRATPTITDQYVYEVGTFGDGFCFERKTGKIVWKHNFREESPYLDGSLKDNGNLEWKGFNGSLVPIGDKLVLFYWQGGNPAIPAWAKTSVTDKMQVFAYSALTGKVLWKFEESCPPGTRGPGLITGGGLPLPFRGKDCLAIHGNRQWKILRLADGQQVWNWECSGPQEAPAWANGGLRPVGNNRYLDALNGWQLALVECDFSAANPQPKVLWSGNEVHEAVTPCVIWNGYIYGFWIDKREEAWAIAAKPDKADFSLRCTELATGKLQWSQPGFRMGLSMSAAEGLIYVRSHQTVTLIEANPHAYVEKGRIERVHDLRNTGARGHKGLLDWNMPVIARGRLFLRTPVEIICYDICDRTANGETSR